MIKATTDWSNLKDETSKAKEQFTKSVGRPTSARVLKADDLPQQRKKCMAEEELCVDMVKHT